MPILKSKNAPPNFKDMPEKDRKDLLKAYCEGEVIEFFSLYGEEWCECSSEPLFRDHVCYRVKPRFEIRKGQDGKDYAVFDIHLKAQDLADMLGISLHRFEDSLNSVAVEDVIKAIEL